MSNEASRPSVLVVATKRQCERNPWKRGDETLFAEVGTVLVGHRFDRVQVLPEVLMDHEWYAREVMPRMRTPAE